MRDLDLEAINGPLLGGGVDVHVQIVSLEAAQLVVDEALRLRVLAELQVGVDREVVLVEPQDRAGHALRRVLLGGGRRQQVRLDRVLPVTEHREDVRGHVQGMWRRRRDLGIAAGGREPAHGQRREVIGVDNVVGDARMVGLLDEHLLENRSRLELPHVRLVSVIYRLVEGERVEDRPFGILGIAEIDLLHRRLISAGPWQMTALVRVPVVDLHGGDIVLLPLRLGTGRFRLLGELSFLRRRLELIGLLAEEEEGRYRDDGDDDDDCDDNGVQRRLRTGPRLYGSRSATSTSAV